MRDETGNATQARLLEVLGHADFEVLPGLYAFVPIDGGAKPRDDALACVRDGSAWRELVPVEAPVGPMTFRIFFPRRHVPRLEDCDDAEVTELFGLIARVARVLDVAHYNVLSNNGLRAGQTVFHAHAHFVPKPDGATGLVAQAGLGVVDQTGLADELRRRLGN